MLPATLLVSLLAAPADAAGQPIQWARVYDDAKVHEPDTAGQTGVRALSWPFCPSTRERCEDYAWVTLGVSLDAYSARRNGPHASIQEIVETSTADLAPLAEALVRLFQERGVTSDAERLGYVQGLVQAVQYARDTSTGFTEYPKYAVEFLVDEQGDCDDAAVAASALLRGLGYPAWFVLWKGAGDEGHISTAVSRDRGDLAAIRVPPGSRLVTVPGTNEELLHVDATGVIGGCTGRCTGLGWNEWYRNTPPLREAVAVRADAKDLDQALNIAAWRNDGTFFPERRLRDRRAGAPDAGEGEEELVQAPEDHAREPEDAWEGGVLRRLRRLGEDEASARRYLTARRKDPVGAATWYLLSAAASAGLAAAAAVAWVARQRRLALAERSRAKRKGEEF